MKLDNTQKVPYLPEDIPFNSEQTQWLGGFLAGLHTKLLVQESNQAPAQAQQAAVRPITIIYGSQTGNAEAVAEDAAEQAKTAGLLPSVVDMDDVELPQLAQAERLLVVTSTYGEGEMPDNAQSLWDAISAEDAPSFANTHYSVLALGDTNYDDFCLAGIHWDERLQELGGQRVVARVDCDVDFEGPANDWIEATMPEIAQRGSAGEAAASTSSAPSAAKKNKPKFNKQNPLHAELITKKRLTEEGSSKETFHYEFSLAGSGETYEAGDALNVIPVNRDDLVQEVINSLNSQSDTEVTYNGQSMTLQTVLTDHLEIRTPSKEFIAHLAGHSADKTLAAIIDDTEKLNDFLWGKDIVDLIKLFPDTALSADEFIELSKALAPRAYSISSSVNFHPEEVHLTIGNVRYNSNDRDHNGVCSTFLSDVAEEGDKVRCYFAPNKHFSVPESDDAPMIMVGPGTGIAPFRAFLEERKASGASGENWLFFGDRNRDTDFIYRDEIEQMQQDGLLTRLDLAFSRDQKKKIYVQDRMLEHGEALFSWLERGGYFFICGDAYRMAKDVDKALHAVIEQHGKMSKEDAEDYVNALKKQKRYVRDVY
ncbi:sulfite reductase subunit alpha [Veronia nyctiphanis]|uniref:Sulfite reductase [NADPH] flavoprotein alpha-component n=1 Tax=Veronia nyctiphanis TaxID=1278244 RepID=A0A4Q0YUH7_9GAMM|nr:sulfite reductase subunit alpha [Veronia nyctiphanis]RXJ74920.1 sulfite reductase subunit alpha [Veronia nyctiphanis]